MTADSALYIPPGQADDHGCGRRTEFPFWRRGLHRTEHPHRDAGAVGRPRAADRGADASCATLPRPYVMLYDLHGVDERLRTQRRGLPAADFTVFYHLMSIERNSDVMLKVALSESDLHLPTVTSIWPNANWYEREVWDLFGIHFRRPPAPDPHHDAADLGRPPAAQGLPGARHRIRPVQPDPGQAGSGEGSPAALQPGRVGHEARQRERGLHVPQPGPEPPVGARCLPHRAATGR